MRFRTGCKINLYLQITGKDEQGYHLLRSVFFPLDNPSDEMEIRPEKDGKFSLHCSRQFDGPDILKKAWQKFCEATGTSPGISIRLIKKIPVGAGLGGGSSDAASLLRWLNDASQMPLPEKQLAIVAKSVGADVPFFLYGTPAFVSGIGENIVPLEFWPEFYTLGIWPGISLSTAAIYQEWDRQHGNAEQLPLTKTIHMDKKKFAWETFGNLCNDLEPCAIGLYPQLAVLKKEILSTGAQAAVMSGSGSCFFGIYETAETAKKAFCELSGHYKNIFLNHIAAKRH